MFSIRDWWWLNQQKHVACVILSYVLCTTDLRKYNCKWKQQWWCAISKDDLTSEMFFLLLLHWHQYILTVALDPENQLNYITTLPNYINIQSKPHVTLPLIWNFSSFHAEFQWTQVTYLCWISSIQDFPQSILNHNSIQKCYMRSIQKVRGMWWRRTIVML
jgi:hypothetical protein